MSWYQKGRLLVSAVAVAVLTACNATHNERLPLTDSFIANSESIQVEMPGLVFFDHNYNIRLGDYQVGAADLSIASSGTFFLSKEKIVFNIQLCRFIIKILYDANFIIWRHSN